MEKELVNKILENFNETDVAMVIAFDEKSSSEKPQPDASEREFQSVTQDRT